jgi:Flp pilus assembly protein TadD
MVLINLRRYDEALEITEAAMQYADQDVVLLEDLIMLYAMDGRGDEALQIVEEIIEQTPDNPDLHLMHDLALAYAGRFDEANDALESALSLGAEPWQVYESMSYNYYYLQDYLRAYQTARLALEFNERNPHAHLRLALAAQALGYSEEACQAAASAHSMVPMRDLVHYALGVCYYESDDLEQARTELGLFLELYYYRPNANLHYEDAIILLEELDA